jgi:hypothetical protein
MTAVADLHALAVAMRSRGLSTHAVVVRLLDAAHDGGLGPVEVEAGAPVVTLRFSAGDVILFDGARWRHERAAG